jgi:hypothetical protein
MEHITEVSIPETLVLIIADQKSLPLSPLHDQTDTFNYSDELSVIIRSPTPEIRLEFVDPSIASKVFKNTVESIPHPI